MCKITLIFCLLTDSGAAHLALHQPPWIIGIGARAAPPELRQIQVHGDRLIARLCCGLCALTVLFYVLLRAESAS